MVGGKLYWTEAQGRIRRANLNGANIEDIVTGLVAPRNLVLAVEAEQLETFVKVSGDNQHGPAVPQLQQNVPNPFNGRTVISYFLLKPGLTSVEVFALTGQRVAVLLQGHQKAGYHRLSWNGRDDAARPLASGVYLYRLVTVEGVLTRKLILLR